MLFQTVGIGRQRSLLYLCEPESPEHLRDLEPLRVQADVTAVLIWISLPIQLENVLNNMAALVVTSGTTFLTGFSKEQVDGLTYLFAMAR